MTTRDLGQIKSLEDVERFTKAYLPKPTSTKQDKELWIFVRSLPLIASHIPPPFSIVQQDSPDFKVTTGNRVFGIEVTAAVPENVAKSASIAREEELEWYSYSPELYSTDSPELYSTDRTASHQAHGKPILQGMMQSGKIPPWHGNAPEAVILDCIITAVEKKIIASKNYTGYDLLLLIVYENTRAPGNILELPHLKTAPSISPFEQVIILSRGKPYLFDGLLTNNIADKRSGDEK